MKANITHQQARELLHSGSSLTAEREHLLDAHLETCASCSEYARLVVTLEANLPDAIPYPVLSDRELAHRQAHLLGRTASRHRRQRILVGARDLAWIAVGAAFVILLSFVLRTLIPRPQPVVSTESTPTLAATLTPQGMLGANSSPAEIRQRILNPIWTTLMVSGYAQETMGDGSKTNRFVQAWLDRSGGGRVLISEQLPDGLEFNAETPLSQVWASDGQRVLNLDLERGVTSPFEGTATFHLLESVDPLLASVFPAMFVDVFEDPVIVEASDLDGRPVIVVDWAGNRLWVDALSGVILRRQTSGENGTAIDVRLLQAAYDGVLPEWTYQLSGLDSSRFVPVILPDTSQPTLAVETPQASPTPLPVVATQIPEQPVGDVVLLDVLTSLTEGQGEQGVNAPELYFIARSLGAPLGRFIMRAGTDCLLTSGHCPASILPGTPDVGDAPLFWSPDGRLALLIDHSGRKLHVYDRQSETWRVLLDNALVSQDIVYWSPEGRQFVISMQGGNSDTSLVTLVDVDVSTTKPIAAELGGVQVPIGWLDAQNFLVMVDRPIPKGQTGTPVGPALYSISVEDATWRELPIEGSAAWLTSYPALAPDGRHIVLSMPGAGGSELSVISSDGAEAQSLGLVGVNPTWSPNGAWIAITVQDGSGTQISIVRPDGSEMRQVFTWGAYSWAAWFPDSQHLLAQVLPPQLSRPEEDRAGMYLVSLVEGWSRRVALSERDLENELVFPAFRNP